MHREGRLSPRHAPLAFYGSDERGLFSADEGPGPKLDLDVEIKRGAEYPFAEEEAAPGLVQRQLEAFNREGIFRPKVYVAFMRADGIPGNDHAFDDRMGIALDHGAVHERAGVSLVRIADNILGITPRLARQFPLQARREPGASPPAQT